jgi:hypothetical protein
VYSYAFGPQLRRLISASTASRDATTQRSSDSAEARALPFNREAAIFVLSGRTSIGPRPDAARNLLAGNRSTRTIRIGTTNSRRSVEAIVAMIAQRSAVCRAPPRCSMLKILSIPVPKRDTTVSAPIGEVSTQPSDATHGTARGLSSPQQAECSRQLTSSEPPRPMNVAADRNIRAPWGGKRAFSRIGKALKG